MHEYTAFLTPLGYAQAALALAAPILAGGAAGLVYWHLAGRPKPRV